MKCVYCEREQMSEEERPARFQVWIHALCPKHRAKWDQPYQRICAVCGEQFKATRRAWGDPIGYCSDECRRSSVLQRQRERRAAARTALDPRSCDRCGEEFVPTRTDARFCSGRCRVAAHRARST